MVGVMGVLLITLVTLLRASSSAFTTRRILGTVKTSTCTGKLPVLYCYMDDKILGTNMISVKFSNLKYIFD